MACAENIGMVKAIFFSMEYCIARWWKCIAIVQKPKYFLKNFVLWQYTGATGKFPNFLHHFSASLIGWWGFCGFSIGNSPPNYNDTGGWKAVAQKGFARCKESILHNLKLWALIGLVWNGACGVEGNVSAAAVTIISIM